MGYDHRTENAEQECNELIKLQCARIAAIDVARGVDRETAVRKARDWMEAAQAAENDPSGVLETLLEDDPVSSPAVNEWQVRAIAKSLLDSREFCF